ncbi:unnamed protein product [Ostreobium quekettii]|uniref:F-box protein n=1 Tax=Ostreobium quekettii TaxID=121088 RepID=A0A8S1J051_9CHLO|nr:unnamed protein product [Ostreobium quekettii]|eukprot:evm.model.scf_554.2 EVM.evm.TU.scf_554.2   scf_554:26757-43796(-)
MEALGFLLLRLPRGASNGPLHVGAPLRLDRLEGPSTGRWALRGDGCLVLEGDTEKRSLLQAMGTLHDTHLVAVNASIVELTAEDLVCKAVLSVSQSLWAGKFTWLKTTSGAFVFSSMHAWDEAEDAIGATPPGAHDGHQEFTLTACLSELPTCWETGKNRGNSASSSWLESVPEPVLQRITTLLDPHSLRALSSTSQYLRFIAGEAVPQLMTTLCPHQRAAVRWMVARERASGEVPHPYIRALKTKSGRPFHVNTVTGEFMLKAPPAVMDFRGGMLCDEPGLGKTVTVLSTIVRTKGTLPEAPAGAQVVHFKDAQNQQVGYYMVDQEELLMGSDDPQETKHISSRRSLRLRPSLNGSKEAEATLVSLESPCTRSSVPLPAAESAVSTPGSAVVQRSLSSPGSVERSGEDSTAISTTRRRLSWNQSRRRDRLPGAQQSGRKRGRGKEMASTTLPSEKKAKKDTGPRVQCAACRQWRVLPIEHKVDNDVKWLCGMHPVEELRYCLIPSGIDEASQVMANVDNWVQCEGCAKWRMLPAGHEIDGESPWFCRMHPDPSLRSCRVAETKGAKGLFSSASGFVSAGATGGKGENVCHFRDVFGPYHHCMGHADYAIYWLADLDPDKLVDGIRIPNAYRFPEGYEDLFKELGLRTFPTPKGRPSYVWKQLDTHRFLRLDTAAIRTVLSSWQKPKQLLARVYLSPATLVVVPPTLVDQWKQQVVHHFNGNLLRVLMLTGSSKQPHIHDLAWGADVILATFGYLSMEWNRRTKLRGNSPLLQIHWLRVVVDEGHLLGNTMAFTSRSQMARMLRAERRWVVTGTPTPQHSPTSHVGHLQPLLAFLRQQPFGLNRKAFDEAIHRPFDAGDVVGRQRLMAVLRHCMLRASKEQLRTLPTAVKKTSFLQFAKEHAQGYNDLVEVIKRNLLLADWGEEDHIESLLSPQNSKWNRQMLKNLRLSCVVAGNCNLQVNEADLKETLELLAERHGMPQGDFFDSPPWVPFGHPLSRIEVALRQGSSCDKCGTRARLPFVTPCAHVLCLDCVSQSRECCPAPSCGTSYRMQGTADKGRRALNPNPKLPVPIEVIEWQPSYTQKGAVGLGGGEWSPTWEETVSSKCDHLLQRLREIGIAKAVCDESNEDGLSGDKEHPGSGGPGEKKLAEGNVAVENTKAIVYTMFWHHMNVIERHLQTNGTHCCTLRSNMMTSEKDIEVHKFKTDPLMRVLLMDVTGAVGLDLSIASHVFLMEPLADRSLESQIVSRANRMGASSTTYVETFVMQGSAEELLLEFYQQSGESQAGGESGRRRRVEGGKTGMGNYVMKKLKRVEV